MVLVSGFGVSALFGCMDLHCTSDRWSSILLSYRYMVVLRMGGMYVDR